MQVEVVAVVAVVAVLPLNAVEAASTALGGSYWTTVAVADPLLLSEVSGCCQANREDQQ